MADEGAGVMRNRRVTVVVTVCVGVLMVSLDLFIVNIAFPDIQKSFRGTGVSDLSWILNAYGKNPLESRINR
jgi:MFS family permease